MTRAIPAAGLPFLTAVVLSCFVAAAPAQQVAKTGTPSIIQIDFGPYGSHLPGDGQDYCYPTTATMLFFWLGANGYSQLAPGYTLSEGLNLDRVLGGLVQTSATGGTYNSNYMDGLDVYLKAKGVSAAERTWATSGNPDIQWFADHNDANTVTLAGVSWYGRNGTSDNFTYEGGHGMALISADTSNSTLTVNNPYPSTFFNVPNTAGQNPMTVDIQPVSGSWTLQSATNPPYIQVATPILGPTPPNSGSPGSLGVFTTGLALTLNPSARPSDPSYAVATWGITGTQSLNTGAGDLSVLAPLADGGSAGGISKSGTGTLELRNTNSLTGANRITGGKISSVATAAQTSTPFGTGGVTIDGEGTLEFKPSDASPASMAFTVASGAGNQLHVEGGAGKIIADRGSNTSLSITVGGITSGSGKNIQLSGAGTLVFALRASVGELGSLVKISTAGGSGNAPNVTNGMVTPAIVGMRSADSDPAAFLTCGAANGFAVAATTGGNINSSTASTIYETGTNQTVSGTAAVYAAVVNNATISSGTLSVGPQASGEAGLILNGSTISSNVSFGSAAAYVYAGGVGGNLSGTITSNAGFTSFGPGTLTVSGDSSGTQSGAIFVNSGTLLVDATGATGSGAVEVRNEASLKVAGTVGGAVNVKDNATATLLGGTLAAGVSVQATGTLEGSGVVSGAAGIQGSLQASSLASPGNITFNGATTFGIASQFYWTLNALTDTPTDAGSAWNTLTFGGTTNFTSQSVTMFLNIPESLDPSSGNAFWNTNHQWIFASGSSGAFTGDGLSIENWSWDSGNFNWYHASDHSEVGLFFTAVPEPSVTALVLAGLGAVAVLGRRRPAVG